MNAPRRIFAAAVALAAPIAVVAPATANAQDPDAGIIVTASRESLNARECAIPIAISAAAQSAQPLQLNDPRNPLGFEFIDTDTVQIGPVQAAAVTLIGDFGFPPASPSPDSGCADFWANSNVVVEGDESFFETSDQWTTIGVRWNDSLLNLGDQAYREFTFLWDIEGLPTVDATVSGLPDFLDGASEGVGYSNNLGEISTLLFRGNGVGADNFSNVLPSVDLLFNGDPWTFVITPRPDPVRIAGTSAAAQSAESVVVVETAQPIVPAGPTTLDEIVAQPGFALIGGGGDGALPEPTTTPAPSTTTPTPSTTTPAPSTASSAATTETPATTSPPATTQAPAATPTPEEATARPDDEPATDDLASDQDPAGDADGDGGSALPILIVLAIAVGVVGVLLWLMLRGRRPRVGPRFVPIDADAEGKAQYMYRRSVVDGAIERGAPVQRGWVPISEVDFDEARFYPYGTGFDVSRTEHTMFLREQNTEGDWVTLDTDLFYGRFWIHSDTLELRRELPDWTPETDPSLQDGPTVEETKPLGTTDDPMLS